MDRKILIVDDSQSVRMIMRTALSGDGYEVIEAENGIDALDKLDSDVNLIVTDLFMPKMDGISLIRFVRELPDHRFTPIIMLTTESQASRKQEGKAAGATAWIVKPFEVVGFLETVRKILR